MVMWLKMKNNAGLYGINCYSCGQKITFTCCASDDEFAL